MSKSARERLARLMQDPKEETRRAFREAAAEEMDELRVEIEVLSKLLQERRELLHGLEEGEAGLDRIAAREAAGDLS